MNVDDVIKAYMKLRETKASIEAKAKAEVKEITAGLGKLETWLKMEADKQGVTSFKTKHGTAFLTTKDFASVENWDVFVRHIKDNDSFDMLDKRCNKTAVRAYIDEHKQVPPGVNYGTMLDINVRKPSANAD